jgi:diguanylate cyclase (GGDEF)-like protein
VKDRDLELAELRRRIARLADEARKNEEAWKRSQRREMALLDADNLPELFGHLTAGLRRGYRLQAASVALADPDYEIRNLLRGQGKEPAVFDDVLFVDTVGRLVPKLRARVGPWLGPFDEGLHRPLFPGGLSLASVALLPLVRGTRIIGSLHFGSDDPDRFTETHATDFLRHLAGMAAFGIENVTNRARLVQRVFTDALTGWHNRSYLETRLGEELSRSQRERTSLVCLMFDVDHFKRVNDDHGHATGDIVLREVARRIGAEVRSSDISARYGGEEFIVLLPHTPLEAGRLLAERIRAAVAAEPFGAGVLDTPLTVTVSIGLAEYRPAGTNEEPDSAAKRLVGNADKALYEAKAAGRNAVALAAA